ncbi:MAG TPA: DUF1491 family protein [Caulobacteraceae bacterium]
MRLDTNIWVYALIRRANSGGAFATVVQRGDGRGGAVLVKLINRRDGTQRLYTETTRLDGEDVWIQPIVADTEADLDAYIARAARIDPDLWVVEIDDPQGRHFLTEVVEGD